MTNALVFNPDDLENIPWERLPDEPEEWFERFEKYFLLLGTSRSLRKAYFTYIQENKPEKVEFYEDRPAAVARNWSEMCHKWKWRQRALEYDRAMMAEARSLVEEARKTLFESATTAVEALQQALKDPRMRVAAAKEILNRVGLPAQTQVDVNVRPYTADDYERAAKEVDAWEQQLLETETSEVSG